VVVVVEVVEKAIATPVGVVISSLYVLLIHLILIFQKYSFFVKI
jgi:hypothetical protein